MTQILDKRNLLEYKFKDVDVTAWFIDGDSTLYQKMDNKNAYAVREAGVVTFDSGVEVNIVEVIIHVESC